ncbi:hypothetical protein IW261DRAFT_1507287 [Armillaria novae-zelandiae]|uniref:Mid2 domain-containing protein n=1 Tax=Armillaria novae-zelandiae TaxID=153914 RepID=A0AA39NWB9_9AGAR|nr:hypothetical protein IW261DRAFT_1507287 [Armillaria novae-zelandiae]
MLAIPLSLILLASYAASWQFQLNSTAVANASASVTWTREADDNPAVGFGFRLRQTDVLPSSETIPYWCQFGGVLETKGEFFVQFYTTGSYIAEAMNRTALQATNSSSDILGSSNVISVQATDSTIQPSGDVVTVNFVAGPAVQVSNPQTTSTTTSDPPTTSSSPSTTRSFIPIPSDTLISSSSASASTSNNTAAIAGSVCGALGLVAIITGAVIWLYRRNKYRDSAWHQPSPGQEPYYSAAPDPYMITSTSTLPVTTQSTPTASDTPRKTLTTRQVLLRDRAEGLRAQVATLRTEGQLIEENERQRRLISSLEREMRYLREQQGSAWALGYTNEPPPSYVSGSSSGLY